MSSSKFLIKSPNVKIVKKKAPPKKHAASDAEALSDDQPLTAEELEKQLQKAALEAKLELEKQIQETQRESFDKGFTEGIREGMTRQKKEYAHTISSVVATMKELAELRQKIIEETEQDILRLVFAVAEKVLSQEVQQNKTVVISVLKEAIRGITARDGMKIHLNPHDFQNITEIKDDLQTDMEGINDILFEEDPGVKPGGVIIETLFGEVDARLNQQLQEIKTGLGAI
jgi:flagellar assembly protein FliH